MTTLTDPNNNIKFKNFTVIECVLFLPYHKGWLEVNVINKPQKPFIHSCKQYDGTMD